MMNNARLNVGMQGVAIAERAYQKALNFAYERKQGVPINNPSKGTVPIIEHPDVKRMLMEMRSQTEAMRALTLITAEALDLSKNYKNPQVATTYTKLVDILTPVVKSWCTDQSVIVTSIGIQVHGGMGFIEDTGAAQYYRDSRILPIYEGTNGIQALDLLKRKLPMDNGKPFMDLMENITEIGDQCIKTKNKNIVNIGRNLNSTTKDLRECYIWLMNSITSNPEIAASGASPFTTMLGWTLGGWVMGKSALRSLERLTKDKNDFFAKSKIKTACFYSDTYLPLASAMKSTIINSHRTINSIE